jgi:ligand-binding SRPBCC domain-containing protein
MPRLELVTSVNAPRDVVFAYSLDVGLHAASMSGSGERAVAGVTAGQMTLGEQVTWRARHFGRWWRMTSRITAYDPPRFFIDEQVAGPFAHWHHAHHFERGDLGTTLMTDVIDFAAPYGPAGSIAEALLLNRYMSRLIQLRNRHLIAEAQRSEDQ